MKPGIHKQNNKVKKIKFTSSNWISYLKNSVRHQHVAPIFWAWISNIYIFLFLIQLRSNKYLWIILLRISRFWGRCCFAIDVLVKVLNLKSNEVSFAFSPSMVSVHPAIKCNERRLEVDVKRPKDRLNQRCFNTLDDGSNSNKFKTENTV